MDAKPQKTEPARKASTSERVLSIIGIILCIILVPILIVNCILLVKGFTQKDEVPSIGGVFPMIVLTGSMEPEFDAGSLIICKEIDPGDIKVRDVISYFDPDSSKQAVTTHRVIEIITEEDGSLAFRTQGDANNTADRTAVPAENVIGIWTGVDLPGVGSAAMFMQTIPGFIICVFVPLLLILGYDLLRRKKHEQKTESDKDDLMRELEELRRLKAAQEAAQEAAQAAAEPAPEAEAEPEAEPESTEDTAP